MSAEPVDAETEAPRADDALAALRITARVDQLPFLLAALATPAQATDQWSTVR
jgi:hypothetical protein